MKTNKSRASLAASILITALAPSHGYAAIIAQWSFADQGNTANANMAASGVISGANASAINIGGGYTQLGQVVDGTFHTYTNSGQNSGRATFADGTDIDTEDTFAIVGDWNDGGTGGPISTAIASNQFVNPTGSGPAGAGALYLGSPGLSKTTLDGAITNNLGITFTVTASGAALNITDFSFYGSRTGGNNDRSWVTWSLQADTGSGFTTLSTSAANTITANDTWSEQTATPFDVTLADGETATFRLIGTSASNSGFGRNVVLDDLVLGGTSAIPEPSTTALLGLGGLALILRRRRK
jgi:hypothetical protein